MVVEVQGGWVSINVYGLDVRTERGTSSSCKSMARRGNLGEESEEENHVGKN